MKKKTSCALFVGLTTLDIVHFLDSGLSRNDKVFDHSTFIGAGGPATNAAIAYSALGGEARLYSEVGQHPVASIIREELDRYGVTHLDKDSERSGKPRIASILVSMDNGDRCVITSAAEASIDWSAVLNAEEALAQATILLIDGHDMPLAISAASAARSRGIPVVLDGGSWKPGTEELLGRVDYAIVAERFKPPGSGGLDVIQFLQEHGLKACAVTRGERDVLFSLRGEKGRLQVPSVDAIDTLAAGDIFHGAYCYAFTVLGYNFVEALEYASKIAAESCRYLGPREWIEHHRSPQANIRLDSEGCLE
jgi:sugar/nucleoside kinase (ribokinase family)